jgi:hypothetical protein
MEIYNDRVSNKTFDLADLIDKSRDDIFDVMNNRKHELHLSAIHETDDFYIKIKTIITEYNKLDDKTIDSLMDKFIVLIKDHCNEVKNHSNSIILFNICYSGINAFLKIIEIKKQQLGLYTSHLKEFKVIDDLIDSMIELEFQDLEVIFIEENIKLQPAAEAL